MSEQELIEQYLSKAEADKNLIKEEMETFFNENKMNSEIEILMRNKFQKKIVDFNGTYSFKSPKVTNIKLLKVCGAKTALYYKELQDYYDNLLEGLK